MSQANAYEQFMLELVNSERAKVGAQPLAFDGSLNTAAENHSAWMIATDTFSHTGANGSSPGDRMAAAGYTFTGSWAWGENIAWVSTHDPAGYQDEMQQLHTNLMNSAPHKANILNDTFKEVGIGLEVGQYGAYNGAFVTQDFAKTGTNSFLTGVAWGDKDGDRSYDVGEGLGSITVAAKNNATGLVTTTATSAAGGYDLELVSGTYTVTFSGGGIASWSQQETIGTRNIKLDLVNPTASTTTTTITGHSWSDTLYGTSGDDSISGLDGYDNLYGQAGNDHLDGGAQNDWLYGGAGADTLTGGTGIDAFVFNTALGNGNVDKITDFSPVDDVMKLDHAVFTGLPLGNLAAGAFQAGTAALDASDRIIYNPTTGAVSFDADGSGAGASQQFAQVNPGTALTNADFSII